MLERNIKFVPAKKRSKYQTAKALIKKVISLAFAGKSLFESENRCLLICDIVFFLDTFWMEAKREAVY